MMWCGNLTSESPQQGYSFKVHDGIFCFATPGVLPLTQMRTFPSSGAPKGGGQTSRSRLC